MNPTGRQGMYRFHKVLLMILVIFVPGQVLSLSSVDSKKPLTHDVYDSWKSISNPDISPNGQWLLLIETPQKGDGELVVRQIDTETEYRYGIGFTGEGTDSERAAKPVFTADSEFVIFMVSPTREEVEKAKKDKKNKKNDKLKKSLGIMHLSDGSVELQERVKSYAVPKESSGWVAYLKEKPEEEKKKKEATDEGEEKPGEEGENKEVTEPEKGEKEGKEESEDKKKEKKKDFGTELIVRSLSSSEETSIASVLEYLFTKNGHTLLYTVSSKDEPESDGLYRLNPGEAGGKPLLAGKGNYKRLALNKEETVLAFLSDRDDYESDEPIYSLYGCKIDESEAKLWISHTTTKEIPAGMAVSEKSGLSFSENGEVLLFGIKEIPEPKKDDEEKEVEEEAKFDLWHWNDPYPFPQQKKMAKEVRDNTWEAVYIVKKKKFVKLADQDLPDLSLNRTGKIAFGQTNWPHAKKVSYFGRFQDVYVIDPSNGKKTLVKEALFGRAQLSPNGKFVAWFEGEDWFIYDIKKRVTYNLTKDLEVRFDREDHDTPQPARSYGVAGWTKNDDSLLVYDRFDIWEFSANGKDRRNVTEGFGRKNDLSFRYLKLDPEEQFIDPSKSILLQATHQETMSTGFFRDRVDGEKTPEKLLFDQVSYGTPKKSKNTERVVFTRQRFSEYPDLWVSDLNFDQPRKMTDLGIQMEPYIWGNTEMIDFKSSDGKPLKGILITPEGFDSNKKYPLMVYIYETLHNGIHRFRNPSPGSSVNPSYYVSNGYLIWMPDIEYDTGYPGKDALKCVLPGVQLLIRKGIVDEKAIGIQGHSWGGYQISYMITQTNIFAAVEAGAPVSNMVSAYGGIRWDSGMVRQFQYEQTQSRLGGSLWENPMRYIENSPIFWADKVQTPILMMHNDQDGAVPWYQGIEYIMALRRLGKEAYMFNYNGEKHGLRKRVNQEDWTIRMAEFFDHHLKGAPMPDWMKDGIKAWEKKEKEAKSED